jgi:chromate transport protein ChrA
MERVDLGALSLHLLALWFVAIGGPSAILPDIHRYVGRRPDCGGKIEKAYSLGIPKQ